MGFNSAFQGLIMSDNTGTILRQNITPPDDIIVGSCYIFQLNHCISYKWAIFELCHCYIH